MADEDQNVEIERLRGRIAALESICIILVRQLLQEDAAAIRSLAASIRESAGELNPLSEASHGLKEAHLDFAANLVRKLE